MTRESLMKLNKISLIKTIEQLEKENRLLKKDKIFICMECDREFTYEQSNCVYDDGTALCPYCNCADTREVIDEY